MGPDEFATREELRLVFDLLLTKLNQQGELVVTLAAMVAQSGSITKEQFDSLISQTEKSSKTVRANQARARLDEYQAIRKIAQQYLDPPSE